MNRVRTVASPLSGSHDAMVIDRHDCVAVALRDLKALCSIECAVGSIVVQESIPAGHKVAIRPVQAGKPVIKYGYPIGIATKDIHVGQLVHTHNLANSPTDQSDSHVYNPSVASFETVACDETIRAYRRKNGTVGIRNDLWIIPTVGCIAHVASSLAAWGSEMIAQQVFQGIDSVKALTHVHGCSQVGADHEQSARLLASLASHPNAAGVLIIALGCENNTLESFMKRIDPSVLDHCKTMVCQEVEDEIDEGKRLLLQLADGASQHQRTDVGIDELVIGTKCGGSDGFSGITANVLVGSLCDYLHARGGSSILTEVPEMFGTESVLYDRCIDSHTYLRLKAVIDKQKQHFISHGCAIYENPSPGNKQGGITTLQEKSLGCIRKGGSWPIMDVIEYGNTVRCNGLSVLEGPGNDMVSITALTAAHAHLIVFTTGRGTPLGTVIPTVKISSHSELARTKSHWIDLDAGRMMHEEPGIVVSTLLQLVKDVASKRILTNNERNGCEDIAIFKDGVTL